MLPVRVARERARLHATGLTGWWGRSSCAISYTELVFVSRQLYVSLVSQPARSGTFASAGPSRATQVGVCLQQIARKVDRREKVVCVDIAVREEIVLHQPHDDAIAKVKATAGVPV